MNKGTNYEKLDQADILGIQAKTALKKTNTIEKERGNANKDKTQGLKKNALLKKSKICGRGSAKKDKSVWGSKKNAHFKKSKICGRRKFYGEKKDHYMALIAFEEGQDELKSG